MKIEQEIKDYIADWDTYSLEVKNQSIDVLISEIITLVQNREREEMVWNIGASIEEANFGKKVAERTGDATAVYEVQEVVRQIQTIIKLLKQND